LRGHIRRRGNKYAVIIELPKDDKGKRQQQWYTAQTLPEAEKLLSKLLHEQDTGRYVKPSKLTLGTFLNDWIKNIGHTISPRTLEGYKTIARRIDKDLGYIPLVQLKPNQIQSYYNQLMSDTGRHDTKGSLSPLTVRHHHALLRRSLRDAVRWDIITRNPCDAIRPPRPQKKQINVMTESEVTAFLEAAKQTDYYALFYTLLYTGLRRSEILALRWLDIDLLYGQLQVNRSLHQLKDTSYVYRSTKTGKGRLVALTPTNIDVLQQHKQQQQANNLLLNKQSKESDLVFSHPDGSPVRPDTVTHVWARIANKLDITASRLHDARHTHATLLLKQGIHPRIVQERLGHSTISVTLDIYSHVTPHMQQLAAQRFDEAFNTRHNTPVKNDANDV